MNNSCWCAFVGVCPGYMQVNYSILVCIQTVTQWSKFKINCLVARRENFKNIVKIEKVVYKNLNIYSHIEKCVFKRVS